MVTSGQMLSPDDIHQMLQETWPKAAVRCLELTSEMAVAALTPAPGDIRPGNLISGPTLFAAADSALWFAILGAIGRTEPMTLTSELSIRFLRPARGDLVYARALVDRVGRTSAVGTVKIWTDDESRPVAVAQGSFVLPAARL